MKDSVLDQICDQFGCKESEIKLLGGYHNNVWEINCGRPIVIKLLDQSPGIIETIRSEVEWMEYLLENGFRVAKPVRFNEKHEVKEISEHHILIAFEKLPGFHVSVENKELWNNDLFNKWGQVMGKMHSLATAYKPINQRPQWFKHPLFNKEICSLEPALLKRWKKYQAGFRHLSVSEGTFGLIHGDLHHQNLLYQEGEISIIDFGDSEYHWFAYDIAIAIYHSAQTMKKGKVRMEFAKRFFHSFMDGYFKENSNIEIVSQIDQFINYRHLFSYVYHWEFSGNHPFTESQRNYLEEMRLSLLNEDSYLGLSLVE
ncbi:phosphotransferase enzyme family protein [Brevibacillus ginsengisoli]|uniref:phosphotransferase enzyme family protein n=1 Tax=Brevibacillus ginsengisoli TaxID=363854 RepID=UPI003CF6B2FC